VDINNTKISGDFGQHYVLRTAADTPSKIAIDPRTFWDPVLTQQFVYGLRVPPGFWPHVLAQFSTAFSNAPRNEAELLERVAALLIMGQLKLFPIRVQDVTNTGDASATFSCKAKSGNTYLFTDASVALTGSPNTKSFHSEPQAQQFISENGLDAETMRGMIKMAEPQTNVAAVGDEKLPVKLAALLVAGSVLVVEQVVSPPAAEASDMEPSAGTVGNKQVDLGPHESGEDGVVAEDSKDDDAGNYASRDDAARAALDEANPQSIDDNLEYGGLIYRDNATGKYGYSGPIRGTDQGVNPSDAPIPPGTELVGDYHTHADYSTYDSATGKAVRTNDPAKDEFNSDNFSQGDFDGIDADSAGKSGYKGYLGTPSGDYKVYDPGTKTTSPL